MTEVAGGMDLWKEFVAFIKKECAFDVAEEEVAQAYLKDFNEYEMLGDHVYRLAKFIEGQFEKRYGRQKGLWFLSDPDHESMKYNEIRVTKKFLIGDFGSAGERFDIEINSLELRWGTVADSEEEFNEVMEDFITKTKKRLDLLREHLEDAEKIYNPKNSTKRGESMMRGIIVTEEKIAEFLEEKLERKPTFEEVSDFLQFVEADTYEWLRDNFKSWMRKRGL